MFRSELEVDEKKENHGKKRQRERSIINHWSMLTTGKKLQRKITEVVRNRKSKLINLGFLLWGFGVLYSLNKIWIIATTNFCTEAKNDTEGYLGSNGKRYIIDKSCSVYSDSYWNSHDNFVLITNGIGLVFCLYYFYTNSIYKLSIGTNLSPDEHRELKEIVCANGSDINPTDSLHRVNKLLTQKTTTTIEILKTRPAALTFFLRANQFRSKKNIVTKPRRNCLDIICFWKKATPSNQQVLDRHNQIFSSGVTDLIAEFLGCEDLPAKAQGLLTNKHNGYKKD